MSKRPWKDKNPPSTGKKLSPDDKARAKARAKAAGRPYPNWVDNAWAAKTAAWDAGLVDGMEKIAEAWQRAEGKNPEGGLNEKGRASLRAQGQNIKRPVSSREAKRSPKAAKRRKSFCARMSGMPGPMKDEKGRPTRKALSLRKWDC